MVEDISEKRVRFGFESSAIDLMGYRNCWITGVEE
jgi:hypothetical protein